MTPALARWAMPALLALGLALHGATTDAYGHRLLALSAAYALMGLGYALVFGHAGALSLAQGAFFGVGAYVAGLLGAKLGWASGATLPLAALAGAAVAAIAALPVLRLETHYFALATLAVAEALRLGAVEWVALTGGGNGVPGVPRLAPFGAAFGPGETALAAWAAVALGAAAVALATHGQRGTAFRLQRTTPLGAAAAGIDAAGLRYAAFVLGAALAGLGGAFQAHTLGVVSPEALDFAVMVACLSLVVVGGRTSLAGPILGAILVVHLPEWFRGLQHWALFAYGAGLLACVLFAPDGLVGAAERHLARLFPARKTPAADPPAPPARAPEAGPVLAAENLAKSFGGNRALADFSLTLAAGEIVALIGANGSGKTTALNLLAGQERADRGRVVLLGRDVTALPAWRRARAGLGRSFQAPALDLDLAARAHVAAARPPGGARAGAALAAVGLVARADAPVSSLDQGERRRLELARALALDPAALLLDEPAAGLSESERADLAALVRRLAATGIGFVIVDHSMDFLLPLADRALCLEAGRIVAAGTPAEIAAHPAVRAAYLGPMPEASPGSAP
jgi:branched-chain amino acid transport system permease protein